MSRASSWEPPWFGVPVVPKHWLCCSAPSDALTPGYPPPGSSKGSPRCAMVLLSPSLPRLAGPGSLWAALAGARAWLRSSRSLGGAETPQRGFSSDFGFLWPVPPAQGGGTAGYMKAGDDSRGWRRGGRSLGVKGQALSAAPAAFESRLGGV